MVLSEFDKNDFIHDIHTVCVAKDFKHNAPHPQKESSKITFAGYSMSRAVLLCFTGLADAFVFIIKTLALLLQSIPAQVVLKRI